ncbi:HCP-like protein, partial [Basidiobolus meristosporus CBS 931.73]
MKISCKSCTLLLLLIGCTISSHAEDESIETPREVSFEDAKPNISPYDQAMALLKSMPKDRVTFKRSKPITNGLFQSQFQKLTTFLYNRIFHSENGDSLRKAPHPKLQQAAALLEAEAKLGNADAIFTLAELNFFSYYDYPRNLKLAFDYYSQLASEKGNATAQRMVGFMFATGIGNVVERDQGKALLYSTFAASGGDYEAQMMVGFRYLMGIGASNNCEKAVEQYKKVADKAMEYYHSGASNRRVPPSPKIRLPDEHGGIYGYAHNGGSIHRDPSEVEDILQYTRELAERGDIQAQISLAHIYYSGGHHIERNYRKAYRYYYDVANSQVRDASDTETSKLIAQARGMLGEMFRRGEGVTQDDETAYEWYIRGVQLESPIANNGLGDMYLKGVVVAEDAEQAKKYFEVASSMGYPEAHVNLGLLHLKAPQPDYANAYALFLKAYEGHYVPAYYHLAELIRKGHVEQPCSTVVTLYKNFVERMDWLHSPFPDAHRAYKKGDIETAFLRYLMAAEMGYEIG